jgi:ribosomal subunit interface protein
MVGPGVRFYALGGEMGLELTFRNLDPSDAMRARAEKKLDRMLNKFRDENSDAHMVFSVEKHRHRVELTIKVQGEQLTIHDETDDMYTSIDNVMNKAARAARRAHDRRLALLRSGGDIDAMSSDASLDDDVED